MFDTVREIVITHDVSIRIDAEGGGTNRTGERDGGKCPSVVKKTLVRIAFVEVLPHDQAGVVDIPRYVAVAPGTSMSVS